MSKLVVVADAAWVVNEVKASLAVDGWQVVEVSDPRQAVETVNQELPEAVVIDMQVGSMGGMAVTRAIRQSVSPRPRLVMLLDRRADRFLARRAGADASIIKPFEGPLLRWALSGMPEQEGEEE